MSPHNMYYLRAYRKRSRLTQSDVAFLLGLPEHTSISHIESGRRMPNLETIILYRLLFEIPQETFFHERKEDFLKEIVNRIHELLRVLHNLPADRHIRSRIDFLERTLNRLTNEKA